MFLKFLPRFRYWLILRIVNDQFRLSVFQILYNIYIIYSPVNYLGKFIFLKNTFLSLSFFVDSFYYLLLLTLNKNKSLWLVGTVSWVVRCLTGNLRPRVRSFAVTILDLLRKSLTQTWLNLFKAKSKDVVGQKCDILVKDRFRRAENLFFKIEI